MSVWQRDSEYSEFDIVADYDITLYNTIYWLPGLDNK